MAAEWRLVKAGGGPPVPRGALLKVHMRSAARMLDLDDDARVLSSTYGGEPVLVRMDKDLLRPEIYEALSELTVGSTVVIPLRGQPYESEPTYVELWVERTEPLDATRIVVACCRLGIPREALESLSASVGGARFQVNGVVLRVEESWEPHLLELIAAARAETSTPEPRVVQGATGTSAEVHYLLATRLFHELAARISQLEMG